MMRAAAVTGIVRDLQGLVGRVPVQRVRESEEHRAALEQALAALNLTKAYLTDVKRNRPPDPQRERQLSMAWTRASRTLEAIDPDLAERCDLEGEDWDDPESWDDEETEEAEAGIDAVLIDIRNLLSGEEPGR